LRRLPDGGAWAESAPHTIDREVDQLKVMLFMRYAKTSMARRLAATERHGNVIDEAIEKPVKEVSATTGQARRRRWRSDLRIVRIRGPWRTQT
jgi:hypothetical protein